VAGSESHRNWLQWIEIGVIAIASVVLVPLAVLGSAIPEARTKALGGLAGIAGLWVITAPTVSTLRNHWKLRLAGTLLAIPGLLVAAAFLRFQIRTGRGLSDVWTALYVSVLPITIALHRLYLGWRPAR
jgi:hypothetical protein